MCKKCAEKVIKTITKDLYISEMTIKEFLYKWCKPTDEYEINQFNEDTRQNVFFLFFLNYI